MIRSSFFVSLVLFVLSLLFPYTSSAYIIDGNPASYFYYLKEYGNVGEWFSASGPHDDDNDVAPEQVDTIDL